MHKIKKIYRKSIKGGIIKYANKSFQNSDIPIGILGVFDPNELKFYPVYDEEGSVYDVKELSTLF